MTLKSAIVPTLSFLLILTAWPALADSTGAEVSAADKHDVSPPLRGIQGKANTAAPNHDKPLRLIHPNAVHPNQNDPVTQSSAGPLVVTSNGLNFEGVGNGFVGPAGTFFPDAAPPDTNGAVGATQYVQWVNESFAVFNKTTGAVVYGPVAGNTLWTSFGGGCESNNDGDPIVQYDKAANRWIMTQFSVSTTPYKQCVAVSQTSDALGSYYRYSFSYTNFPDYGKLGVWPDGYYMSYNMFAGNSFVGSQVCAFDRAQMLAGLAATQQCFQLSPSFGGLLPSDLDGSTLPPAGAPNLFLAFGFNTLQHWKFHVDWANSANSTLTGPGTIAVAAFNELCNGGACVPQSGTKQKLDSLGDRLMHRLAYRNFGDHQALVVNHSVSTGTAGGVRWYEVRLPGGVPTLFQQGTYAPDSSYRWMGSIGMDRSGNIAVGYSTSSSAMHPAIRYTGRLSGDPLGALQAETSIIAGTGSQTFGLNRWGDYSALTIDPVDDCTFWYTNEYLPSNGSFNWRTRIASFHFPSCGAVGNDFSISATPASQSVSTSGGTTPPYTVTTAVTNGVAETITLSLSGGPVGSTYAFIQPSVTAGGSSSLTVTTLAGTAAGTYPLTITGTSLISSIAHSTGVNLVVAALPAAPTNVTGTVANVNGNRPRSVDVFWTDASNNEDSFLVDRCTGAGCITFAQIGSVGANVTTFRDGSVSRGNTYRYRVRSHNAAGDGTSVPSANVVVN